MEAIFFTATRERATQIRSVDDLDDDPAAEPLRIQSPGGVVALSSALCGRDDGGLEQLQDATCQSFPVWTLPAEAVDALTALSEDTMDLVATDWLARAGTDELDTDLYELTTCLSDLRDAVVAVAASDEQLFVLFEEKAFV